MIKKVNYNKKYKNYYNTLYNHIRTINIYIKIIL